MLCVWRLRPNSHWVTSYYSNNDEGHLFLVTDIQKDEFSPSQFIILLFNFISIFLLSTFIRNFFLFQDRWHSDVPSHLAQPCYVALGQALIQGLCPLECSNSNSREKSIAFVWNWTRVRCVQSAWHTNVSDCPA